MKNIARLSKIQIEMKDGKRYFLSGVSNAFVDDHRVLIAKLDDSRGQMCFNFDEVEWYCYLPDSADISFSHEP